MAAKEANIQCLKSLTCTLTGKNRKVWSKSKQPLKAFEGHCTYRLNTAHLVNCSLVCGRSSISKQSNQRLYLCLFSRQAFAVAHHFKIFTQRLECVRIFPACLAEIVQTWKATSIAHSDFFFSFFRDRVGSHSAAQTRTQWHNQGSLQPQPLGLK